MAKEVKIEQILFWVIVALLIIFLLWRALGSSPPVEAVGLLLTAMGALFGWYSIKSSNKIFGKLDEQTNLLKDLKEILERKL